jgi:transketolase
MTDVSRPGFGRRRGQWIDTGDLGSAVPQIDSAALDSFDLIYRALCAILFNFVPTSGHPGGSISSGRIVSSLLFGRAAIDLSDPERDDSDVISYAAGHKALGLYAMYALRNEIARVAAPQLLPADERFQLRLEDLLGFRRNPVQATPLFRALRSKALDGHPSPATPFVRLATGASGVGVASSIGYALALSDYFGEETPAVHIIEGEGGLTPGRVSESLAIAATASLRNIVVHVDWNQSSIDSDHVTSEGERSGDYVQWTPAELFHLHDWNVINVDDGFDFAKIAAAQQLAGSMPNSQPTAIIYRTIKGWRYGIEGKASHGAGHKLCSAGYHDAILPLLELAGVETPWCELSIQRCEEPPEGEVLEACYWETLGIVRTAVEKSELMARSLASRLVESKERLDRSERLPREAAPHVDSVYERAADPFVPDHLLLAPGSSSTLRGQLSRILAYYNRTSGGAFLVSAADLLGSTSLIDAAEGSLGFYHSRDARESRIVSAGGICEDAMGGMLSGISTFGRHIGVGASYAAFIAPLSHIAMRLHAIGMQSREKVTRRQFDPMIVICGHTGLKTGEDGPTHADPQPLQLLQENFPRGSVITLTPWEAQEIWSLVAAALSHRPAVIAPFVTRPDEVVLDREALGLSPASMAAKGLYPLRPTLPDSDGTVVLQGSGVTHEFVLRALPKLDAAGVRINVFYVSSAELFDLLPREEQESIFPESAAREAIGITGFTLPTMYRWVTSRLGRSMSMYPFQHGSYLGSGRGDMILAEAGLDGESQYQRVEEYVRAVKGRAAR